MSKSVAMNLQIKLPTFTGWEFYLYKRNGHPTNSTMKKLYVLVLMCGFVFSGTGQAFGQTTESTILPEIYISEVNWAGSSQSLADEWIEITNRSGSTMDIGGWIIDGAATSAGAIQIANNTLLIAGDTLLIANYEFGHEKTTLNIMPDLVTSAVSLANNELTLRLINPAGLVVDEVAFGSSPNAGSNNPFASAVREADGSWVTANTSTNLTESGQYGTPGVTDIAPFSSAPIENNEAGESTVTDPESNVEDPETISLDTDDTSCCGCVCTSPPDNIIDNETESIEDDTYPTDEDVTDTEQESTAGTTQNATEDTYTNEDPDSELTNNGSTAQDLDTDEDTDTEHAIAGEANGAQSSLRISEFVSDPADGTEWIELWNNDAKSVDTQGMYILDVGGGKTVLSGVLETHSYNIIENPKGKLNNDGDSVLLYSVEGILVDQVQYGNSTIPAAKKGQSVGLIAGTWQVLDTPTPGKENLPNAILETETSYTPDKDESDNTQEADMETVTNDSNEAIEKTEEGELIVGSKNETDTVTIVSIAQQSSTNTKKGSTKPSTKNSTIVANISVVPGILGKQIAYIPGYQVYFYKADWPELHTGDLVQLTGIVSTVNGERRFKISNATDITILESGHLNPEEFTVADESTIGKLVKFNGAIGDRGKRDLHLNINGMSIRVRLPKDLNGNLLAQESLQGIGVIRATKDEFYIEVIDKNTLVIAQTDFTQIQEYNTVHHKHKNSKSVAGASIFTGALGAVGYWIRKSLLFS